MRRPPILTPLLTLAALALAPPAVSRAQPDLPVAEGATQPPGETPFAEPLAPTEVTDQVEPAGRTPLQLWDRAREFLAQGQPRLASSYIKLFVESNPDDATLIQIHDRDGVAAVERLRDDPPTRPYAQPILDGIRAALTRSALQPERIGRYIGMLTGTRREQDYAVERLNEGGPFVVPYLVRELQRQDRSPEQAAQEIINMGRMDRSTVPAWLATLDSPDPILRSDVAQILGLLGDRRAIPQLTFQGAQTDRLAPDALSARRAVEQLTGRHFAAQPLSPILLLAEEAKRYRDHLYPLPARVLVWVWDEANQVPVPREMSGAEAERYFETLYSREVLQLVAPTGGAPPSGVTIPAATPASIPVTPAGGP